MAKARGDYGDILVKNQVISSDQLQESRDVMKNGGSLQDALLKLSMPILSKLPKLLLNLIITNLLI